MKSMQITTMLRVALGICLISIAVPSTTLAMGKKKPEDLAGITCRFDRTLQAQSSVSKVITSTDAVELWIDEDTRPYEQGTGTLGKVKYFSASAEPVTFPMIPLSALTQSRKLKAPLQRLGEIEGSKSIHVLELSLEGFQNPWNTSPARITVWIPTQKDVLAQNNPSHFPHFQGSPDNPIILTGAFVEFGRPGSTDPQPLQLLGPCWK